jgi:hypothetical protein
MLGAGARKRYCWLVFCAVSGACLFQPGAAQVQGVDEINRIADLMVRLCVGGGHTETVSGSGSGGADLSLRSLDVRGNLQGQFKIDRSRAEGLASGIDNAMSQVAADQADKVRDCLKPVRERLLDLMLPRPDAGPGRNRPGGRSNVDIEPASWIGSWKSGELMNPAWLGSYKVMLELFQVGPNVAGQIKIATGWFSMKDLEVTTDSISFYVKSILVSGINNQNTEAEEFYFGERRGDTIRFKSWDDAGGGPPFEFTVTRIK